MTFNPSKFEYTRVMAAVELENQARLNPDRLVIYSVGTCWWGFIEDAYRHPSGLPCDPRGALLMQTEMVKFWRNAMENHQHYGRGGMDSLVMAHHGNVIVKETRRPTCFESWDHYADLLFHIRTGGT